jgi:hypothetical protein
MSTFPRTVALSLSVLLLLSVPRAGATVLRAVEFGQKVDDAAAIVLGRCIRQTSEWDATKRWILTYSTFRVEKTMKGFPSQEITIVTPGGVVGNVAQDTIGVPKFRTGDERVLFVKHSTAGPTVLYLEQGAYRVTTDDRGDRLVTPDLSTGVVVDSGRGRAVALESPRPLRDFEGRVRDTVRKRDAQRMELTEQRHKAETSIVSRVRRNRGLVALALAGALLASWQIYRRW